MFTVLRLNMQAPGLDPTRLSLAYQAALDMAEYVDANGFDAVTTDEHHGADNGWMPSTLTFTGMLVARTRRMAIAVNALLLPLHDPIRVAEDIAVLDLASGGRVAVTMGLGYRPEEYVAHRKDWAHRGALMDESLEVILKAWTGEPFEYHGTTVRVTPHPLTKPHPPIMVGGSSRPAARRAARFRLPFSPAAYVPDLEPYFEEQCRSRGYEGVMLSPPPHISLTFVARDPDKAWAELGHHFLHEATTYAAWQTPDIRSGVHSHATTVAELRAEGIYEILTPEACRARAEEHDDARFVLHPLCGGLPPDRAWECVELFSREVLGR